MTTAKALLLHVRDRWAIENSWHWSRDTQLKEKAHRYREPNGVRIMATLRGLAMNALRLDDFWSITEGLAALAHDIRGLLALLGWRGPTQGLNSGCLLIGSWSAPVTFRKVVTPGLPYRRPGLRVAPGADRALLLACLSTLLPVDSSSVWHRSSAFDLHGGRPRRPQLAAGK